MAGPIVCTQCGGVLPSDRFNTSDLVPCPRCDSRLRVEVFPALFQPPASGSPAERLLDDGQSSCFYHPQKKAVIPCDACGRFLCALCDVEFNGQHLCPVCLEAGKKKGRLTGLQNHRVLYDNVALTLAILPLLIFWLTLVTAPMALYVGIHYWNAPTSITPRSKARMAAAIGIAGLQLIGWIAGVWYFLMRQR